MNIANEAKEANEGSSSSSPAAAPPRGDAPSKGALWGGRVLSGLGVAFMAMDASMKLAKAQVAIDGTTVLGWPASVVQPLGVVQALCLVLYLVPRTAVLGAVLWTGYLGGAVATHVRIGSPLFSHILFPIYVALFFWGGLWLRDTRLRALFPLRK